MNPQGASAEGPSIRGHVSDRDGNHSNRRLRVVLFLGFGGLLIFLFLTGASALQTLRKLHEVEESVQRKSLERERVLATVIISANVYSDHMEEFLLNPQQAEEGARGEISKRADATRASLRSYPADRSPEEQSLIEQLETFLAEQEGVVRGSKEWKPEERWSRAEHVITESILPRRLQFVAIAQQVELLNDSQMLAAEQGAFLQVGRCAGDRTPVDFAGTSRRGGASAGAAVAGHRATIQTASERRRKGPRNRAADQDPGGEDAAGGTQYRAAFTPFDAR